MSLEIPASHRPILEAASVGVLTTIGRDGLPQSTAVWYLLDAEVVRTSLLETRQKVRNLRNNPRCNLFIFERGNPFKTIELRGQATLEPDPDRSFMARILRHYGHDPDTFPDDRSVERVVFTLTPSRVVASG